MTMKPSNLPHGQWPLTPGNLPYDYGQTDVFTIENLDFGYGHGQNF